MVRPKKTRKISVDPTVYYFKPRGVPMLELEEVVLRLDEFEALRLADVELFYQEKAAKRMRVSRATFGNILSSARRKVSDALIHGRALKIECSDEARPKSSIPTGGCRHESSNEIRAKDSKKK